eukprot:m.437803 g.437803  ORF g.437803 m.437803 type:complete len:259 (-) comp18158_c0_seq1:107-883(-)
MAKRKGAEANSQEEGDNTATLSPAERAAAARAQIREQKRALKRLRLDEKKAAKAKQREATEAVRKDKSDGVDVTDQGWPLELSTGASRVAFVTSSVWDARLDAATLDSYGVPEVARGLPKDLKQMVAPYAAIEAVAVRRVTSKEHPACGQHGLFAARYIPPRTHVLDYVGFITDETRCSTTSDFIMRLDGPLSVDAERCGNQARFINDFRGVAAKPNVELVLGSERPPTMQVWTAAEGVAAGTELLLSYGKGFWEARR